MYQQPVKKKQGTVLPWIAIAILGIIYFGSKLNFNSAEKSEFGEELELWEEEQWKPKKQKKKVRFEDFVIKKGGKYELSEARKKKLAEDLARFDNAETYAIIARSDGERACPMCLVQYNKPNIFLLKDEVWKYGVVRSASLSIA